MILQNLSKTLDLSKTSVVEKALKELQEMTDEKSAKLAEYHRLKGAAWVKYERAIRASWEELQDKCATDGEAAWTAHKQTNTAALDEYKRACSAASLKCDLRRIDSI
jgi:hypothetical protein